MTDSFRSTPVVQKPDASPPEGLPDLDGMLDELVIATQWYSNWDPHPDDRDQIPFATPEDAYRAAVAARSALLSEYARLQECWDFASQSWTQEVDALRALVFTPEEARRLQQVLHLIYDIPEFEFRQLCEKLSRLSTESVSPNPPKE